MKHAEQPKTTAIAHGHPDYEALLAAWVHLEPDQTTVTFNGVRWQLGEPDAQGLRTFVSAE